MENESESKECMYIGKYDYMEKNVNRNQTEKEMVENVNQTEEQIAANVNQSRTEREMGESGDREQTETIRGLTALQVEERKEKGLWNRKAESATKTTKEIVKSNVFTYFKKNAAFFLCNRWIF